MAKRAARNNPAFHAASIHAVAQDAGQTVRDAYGNFAFDLVEGTFGFVDRTKETIFTLGADYEGQPHVRVLSEHPPTSVALILIDGTF